MSVVSRNYGGKRRELDIAVMYGWFQGALIVGLARSPWGSFCRSGHKNDNEWFPLA